MRKAIIITIIAAVFAPAALAVEPPAEPKNASVQCKALKKAMGATEFTKLYRSHGACVTKQDAQAATAAKNAAVACKEEAAMPEADFKAAHGDKTFAQLYGDAKQNQSENGKAKGQSNGTGNSQATADQSDANAHGNCVSSKASEKTATQQAASLTAAKTCKAWAKAPTTEQSALAVADATKGTFALRYGTKKNAYGKCVSHQAKVVAAAKQASQTG